MPAPGRARPVSTISPPSTTMRIPGDFWVIAGTDWPGSRLSRHARTRSLSTTWV